MYKFQNNVTRQHKDVLFRMIFKEKKELLSLYNALAGTNHTDPELIQVVTLENAIYITVKNDLAFIIDSQLHMYEHQSSSNPNMPLRYLFYVAKELERLVKNEDLHSTRHRKIPTPRFVVFYNGTENTAESWTEKLSDAFEVQTDSPALELTVKFFNINYGSNCQLMEKCNALNGYSFLIKLIREYSLTTDSLEEAVEKAIDECIQKDILTEFLNKNRREAGQVILYEFDEERYKKILYNDGVEDGWARGRAEGKAEGRAEGKAEGKAEGRAESINNLVVNMNLTLDQAMDALGITSEEREVYYEKMKV